MSMIIDAHLHIGQPGCFFSPQSNLEQLLQVMDRLRIGAAICTDHVSIFEGCGKTLPFMREVYERSGGRIAYLGVYQPQYAGECLAALETAVDWPGFLGIKIHPSIHKTPAESPLYEPIWRFAAEHDLPMMTHSWSASDYNPVQQYSLPARFESYVQAFPKVRFVLGHSGGRGKERADAIRMANEYPNVYMDIAGDVFCYRLIETLVEQVSADKIIYGSDYPWLDPCANLARVLLSGIDETAKRKILCENARTVYRWEESRCSV